MKKNSDIDIKSSGSILETKEPCDVHHSSVKFQQAQVQPGRVKPSPTFKVVILKQLKVGKSLTITDVAVSSDNKVFFCNFVSVGTILVYSINGYKLKMKLEYNKLIHCPSYPYGISLLTGTDKAIITLPYESYVQYINTKSFIMDKTVEVGKGWFGIANSDDFLVVGKTEEIRILKQNGEIIKTIVLSDNMFINVNSLLFNHHDGSIIYRKNGELRRIQLDGTVLHQYAVAGESGLAVDAQGNVYVSEEDKSEIQRLLPDGIFHDVILTGNDIKAKPYAITFNESYTKFVVTNNAGYVQIYDCH